MRLHARTRTRATGSVLLPESYSLPSLLFLPFLYEKCKGKEVWNTELYFTCLKMTLLHKLIYYGKLYLFVWPHH